MWHTAGNQRHPQNKSVKHRGQLLCIAYYLYADVSRKEVTLFPDKLVKSRNKSMYSCLHIVFVNGKNCQKGYYDSVLPAWNYNPKTINSKALLASAC